MRRQYLYLAHDFFGLRTVVEVQYFFSVAVASSTWLAGLIKLSRVLAVSRTLSAVRPRCWSSIQDVLDKSISRQAFLKKSLPFTCILFRHSVSVCLWNDCTAKTIKSVSAFFYFKNIKACHDIHNEWHVAILVTQKKLSYKYYFILYLIYLYTLIYEAKHVLKQYLILLVWFCFMSFHKYIAMFHLIFKSMDS